MTPIRFQMECCATREEVRENVLATLKRGYEGLTTYLGGTNRVCSIVGSGPSLADTYDDLRGHVMAVNGALNFLLDREIAPHMAMLWDASPLVATFAVPHPHVIYLVNARCHPYVFERLKGCRVVVWFAGEAVTREILLERGINEPLVNGGSAGVTRAMFLAFALGYRELHTFGADSSYRGNATHIQGSLAHEGDLTVQLEENGPSFRTTPELCIQAREHAQILPMFSRLGAGIQVHGDGLLPYVHGRA